jgi:hypothetical protein
VREQTKKRLEPELRRVYKAAVQRGRDADVIEPLRPTAGRQLFRRLASTIIGLAVAVFAYIYLLAWVFVSVATATEWTGEDISTARLDLVVASIHAPGDTYLVVVGLLSIIATAVLLAFSLTEEHYAEDLTGALLKPIRPSMPLALVYAELRARKAP